MAHWALDLGTTNTALARWDVTAERPVLVRMPRIAREPADHDPLASARVVPTATEVAPGDDLWSVLGRLPPFRGALTWGRHGYIGRQAVERNVTTERASYVPSIKPWLQQAALEPVASHGGRRYTAREVARIFLRELLAEAARVSGERIRSLTVTAPVDAYESYRAELRGLLSGLGVHDLHFVDEPVAAAVGYGVSVREARRVLVVDFGGGTLDMALLAIDARGVEEGSATVLSKAGRPIGGDLVDRWLLEWFLDQVDARLPVAEDRFWGRLLLREARWVKEALHFREQEPFHLEPPEHLRTAARQAHDMVEVSRDDLVGVLQERGLYRELAACADEVLADHRRPDDVLMIGGSNLLPGVFPLFEERFGRDRVRAWHPFEAVVYGACSLAASDFAPADFIVHDYAFVVHDPKTGEPGHTTVVPAGTRFPTRPDLWKRQVVPTCALGVPERIFKLVICEIGRNHPGERSFGWDAAGQLHKLDGERLVVPLNEANPALGILDPPHQPSDRTPRLELAFGVDAERWLIATVTDLKTGRQLMDREPVVRLL